MTKGLKVLVSESLSRLQSLKDIQLMSLAKSLSVLDPHHFGTLRSEARRRGRLLDLSNFYHTTSGHSELISWENHSCMVVNKPQGMVVSLDGDLKDTRVPIARSPLTGSPEIHTVISHHFPDIPILSDASFAYGILHRLDRDTTGALVVAKTYESFFDLRMQFAARKILKEYVCIVEGHAGEFGRWCNIRKRIETKKSFDASKNLSFHSRIVDQGGEYAWTDFMPLATYAFNNNPGKLATLTRVLIHTGRTHQIRVHMASEGHPLLFDSKYGGAASPAKFFLHANKISFINPASEREDDVIDVEVPLPSALRNFISNELVLVDGTPI
jgi:23S rRNA-/tRNA-specific pseudouridylate synthase